MNAEIFYRTYRMTQIITNSMSHWRWVYFPGFYIWLLFATKIYDNEWGKKFKDDFVFVWNFVQPFLKPRRLDAFTDANLSIESIDLKYLLHNIL